MAICSGCSGGDTLCHCSLTVTDTASLNLTLTGDGSSGTPWNLSGVAAGGGGGGTCAQKNMYTVSTIGLQGFGAYFGTPEPFLSCADFVGDGVNDQAAINAAATAAVGTLLLDDYPEIYLNGGVYVIQSSINAKSTSIRGVPGGSAFSKRSIITNDATASGFTMMIDPEVLQDLAIGNLLATNAGATIQVNATINVTYERCAFANFGLGASNGVIEINSSGGTVTLQDNRISFSDGSNIAQPGTFFAGGGFSGNLVNILNNNFIGCTIDLKGLFQGSQIKGNFVQLPGGGPTIANRGAINLIHPGGNVAISNWQICGNNIANVAGHGIYVDGGTNPSGFFAWSLIHDNLIYGYGGSGVSQFDGIILLGNTDELSIQGNKCGGIVGAGARHGINISAATCNDNLVTNNDLFNSGAGASINDAGTATVLVAGNRL